MTTRKQAAANKKNAQKSTGPKTEDGKRISSKNAWKHGMLAGAEGATIDQDDRFNDIYMGLIAEYHPVSIVETALVRRMAVALERERRGQEYEHTKYSLEHFNHVRGRVLPEISTESETFRRAFSELPHHPDIDDMLKIARYQKSISAIFDDARSQLEKNQKARKEEERTRECI